MSGKIKVNKKREDVLLVKRSPADPPPLEHRRALFWFWEVFQFNYYGYEEKGFGATSVQLLTPGAPALTVAHITWLFIFMVFITVCTCWFICLLPSQVLSASARPSVPSGIRQLI